MTAAPRNDAELARMLGVDKAIVSRHKKRGMPTHTLEAAQAWRAENLLPAMRKDINDLRDPARSQPNSKAAGAVALRTVQQLTHAAVTLIDAQRFDLVERELRAALRAVPVAMRGQVKMPDAVWHALCACLWARVGEPNGATPAEDQTGAAAEVDPRFAAFLYSVAAGEPADVSWLDD